MNWLHGLLLLSLLSAASTATGPSRIEKDCAPNDVIQNSIYTLDDDCLFNIAQRLRPLEKKSVELASKHFHNRLFTETEREGLKSDIDATNKELALLFQKEEEAYVALPMFPFPKSSQNIPMFDEAKQAKNLEQMMKNLGELADPLVVAVAVWKTKRGLELKMKSESGIMDEQEIRTYFAYGVELLESHLRKHVADPTRIKGAIKDAWKEKSALERAVDDNLSHAVRFILGFNRSYRPRQYNELLKNMVVTDNNEVIAALLEFASREQFALTFESAVKLLYLHPESEHKVLASLLEDERTLTLMESALCKVQEKYEEYDEPIFKVLDNNRLETFAVNMNEMLGKCLRTDRIVLHSKHAEPPLQPSFTLAIAQNANP